MSALRGPCFDPLDKRAELATKSCATYRLLHDTLCLQASGGDLSDCVVANDAIVILPCLVVRLRGDTMQFNDAMPVQCGLLRRQLRRSPL